MPMASIGAQNLYPVLHARPKLVVKSWSDFRAARPVSEDSARRGASWLARDASYDWLWLARLVWDTRDAAFDPRPLL